MQRVTRGRAACDCKKVVRGTPGGQMCTHPRTRAKGRDRGVRKRGWRKAWWVAGVKKTPGGRVCTHPRAKEGPEEAGRGQEWPGEAGAAGRLASGGCRKRLAGKCARTQGRRRGRERPGLQGACKAPPNAAGGSSPVWRGAGGCPGVHGVGRESCGSAPRLVNGHRRFRGVDLSRLVWGALRQIISYGLDWLEMVG